MKTTLNEIRRCNCLPFESYETLLRCLNKTRPDDKPLPMVDVLDVIGFEDTLRCMAAVEGFDREVRLYAVNCVNHVRARLTDPRNIAMFEVAGAYAEGEATGLEFNATWDAANHAGDGEAGSAAWMLGFYGIKSALRNIVAAVDKALNNSAISESARAQMIHDFQALIALETEHHKIGIRKVG